MSTSSKRKSEFLGMAYGTASHRLRKQIMLMLLQRLNADICFKCSLQIKTPEELSIEHIEPWLGRDDGIEKYWDLDNIAFSHLVCNVPHDRSKPDLRQVGPEGTAWCKDCEKFLPTEMFHRHNGRWNGVQGSCIEHMKARRKGWTK